MKIKRLAALGSIAAVAGLALASCNGTQTKTSAPAGSTSAEPSATDESRSDELNVYINYKGQAGVTLRDANGFNNAVEGKNYVKGDLLPVWEELQTRVGYKINEASEYGKTSDGDVYKAVKAAGYKCETNANKYIDLFYNGTSNIEKMGAAGEAVDLTTYINDGTMPNFKAFLDKNPTMKKALTKNGKIFYTPYFDGYNNIERMFVVDTNLVKKVLDADDATKDTNSVQGASSTGLAAAEYEPFINADFNYAADTTVKVSKNATAQDLVIKKTENIIKQQNASLRAATHTSGAALRAQFKAYLTAAFGENVGEGKLYANYSDIFISESAAYNTDELIALMRVIKASPELITNDASQEIEIMCPRGQDSTRIQNVMMLMKIFGIQGVDGEKDNLYYDQDGKLNDMASTKATYTALGYLSQLYDEGLIMGDFYKTAASNSGTAYTAKYFGKTAEGSGYGFMLYDFCATQAAMNTKDSDGVGTADDKRNGSFKNTSVTGIMPILSPLTYWATEKGANAKDDELSNRTHKTLIRYEESNRALKTTSWCIPTTSRNKVAAAKLMDYFMGKDGQILNDFGPKKYWASENMTFTYLDETTPEFSATTKNLISTSGKDFWTTLRNYLGATHGVGYVRTATINYLATNAYGKIGQLNMDNSIKSGVTNLCKVDKYATGATFDTSVPSSGYPTVSDAVAASYDAVSTFWTNADKLAADAVGWVKYVVTPFADITDSLACGTTTLGSAAYNYGQVKSQIAARISDYLFAMADQFDAVPAYIQA